MKQLFVLTVALAFALSGTARAEDDEAALARAKPFLTDKDQEAVAVTGAFGPAKDTTIVFAYRQSGRTGKYIGFALVPDDKAKHGQRKVELPALPQGLRFGPDGASVLLVANLDQDADDELVVGFSLSLGGSDGHGLGGTVGIWKYAVLDWNGKKFVHLPALENKKLAHDSSLSAVASSGLSATAVLSASTAAR